MRYVIAILLALAGGPCAAYELLNPGSEPVRAPTPAEPYGVPGPYGDMPGDWGRTPVSERGRMPDLTPRYDLKTRRDMHEWSCQGNAPTGPGRSEALSECRRGAPTE